MGKKWRAKKRKQWPRTEPHPGVNSGRAHASRVHGGASDDYQLGSTRVRSLRKWRQLRSFALGFLALFGLVAWLMWSNVSDFWELLGAFTIVGKYVVLALGPLILLGVAIYYYVGVGTEWPVATAYRLVMIASLLGIFVLAIALAALEREGGLGPLGSWVWLGLGLGILALVGYVGQRD